MKTLYLSGPISYNPVTALDEFKLAQQELTKKGYKVINPFDLTEGKDLHPINDYETIMRIDVAEMVMYADEVVTLMNWETSPGALREVDIARKMNIPVVSITKYFSNATNSTITQPA